MGTPQCLIAEGLADLGPRGAAGRRPEAGRGRAPAPAWHAVYDAEVAGGVARAARGLTACEANLGPLLHEEGADPAESPPTPSAGGCHPARAPKLVQFQTDPTWWAYMTCYIEGVRLCRGFVAGDPVRFQRLVTEQLTPDQLAA